MTAMTDDPSTAWPRHVFLDTNFVVNLAFEPGESHTEALRLFRRLLLSAHQGEVHLHLSPLVLDEVWWKLAEVLYDEHHGDQAWRRLRWARRKAALEEYRREITETTALLLRPGLLTVESVTAVDAAQALLYATHTAEPHLAPRDALHLAVMKRLGIEGIVTNDPDFVDAPGIVVIPYANL